MTPGKVLHWHGKCSLLSLHRGGLRLSRALKLWPRWLLNTLAAQISYCLGSSTRIVLLFLLLLLNRAFSFCRMQRLETLSSACVKLVTCPGCNPAFTPRLLGRLENGRVGGCKKRAKCDVFWISVQDDYCYHEKLRHCSVGFKKKRIWKTAWTDLPIRSEVNPGIFK